jgi:integrase
MEFVQPIRDTRKIAQIKNLLRGEKRYRDLLLFTMGINTALRISDLLELTIDHVIDENGEIRQSFEITERKREKRNVVTINNSMRSVLEEYLDAYPNVQDCPENALFFNTRTKDYSQPIKRVAAWKMLGGICKDVGLTGKYGTHSLRKTWGYHAWKNGVALPIIMGKLNHNNLSYTKRYLGVTDDDMQKIANGLNL